MSVTQASNSPNGHLSELGFLDSRRSVPARQLGAPGPDHDTVLRMLQSASRVPDHGRRVPFRFVRIAGDARLELGDALAELTIAIGRAQCRERGRQLGINTGAAGT